MCHRTEIQKIRIFDKFHENPSVFTAGHTLPEVSQRKVVLTQNESFQKFLSDEQRNSTATAYSIEIEEKKEENLV